MNESTAGVTLYSGFIADLLSCFPEGGGTFAGELYAMAAEHRSDDPTTPVPIEVYNRMCDWIEHRLGKATLNRAGQAIGERAYSQMVEAQGLSGSPSPHDILQGLKVAAAAMIQDPEGRGWEILERGDGRVLMRRTQTFNCMLQEGLLQALVKKTGVRLPIVKHQHCTRRGDEFCDYAVTWIT